MKFTTKPLKVKKRKEKEITPWDFKIEDAKIVISAEAFEKYNFKENGISVAANSDDVHGTYIRIHSDSPEFYETKGTKKNHAFKNKLFTNYLGVTQNLSREVVLEATEKESYFKVVSYVVPEAPATLVPEVWTEVVSNSSAEERLISTDDVVEELIYNAESRGAVEEEIRTQEHNEVASRSPFFNN